MTQNIDYKFPNQEMSFDDEIENDKKKFEELLKRKDDPSVDVVKRALLLLGCGGLEIADTDGTTKSAADNGLPTCTYLAHGGRTLIQIPKGSGDKLINWLTSGDPAKSGVSMRQSQEAAISEGKIVYNRSAATHAVEIKKEEGKHVLTELKGFKIGAKSFLSNKLLRKDTKHFGVDLPFNGVKKADGENGHFYIYYEPPTDSKPGAMLIGIENAAPSSSKHSKVGASNPETCIGGSKFRVLRHKLQNSNILIPSQYNGMKVNLTKQGLKSITSMNAFNCDNLAHVKPEKTFKAFILQNIRNIKVEAVSRSPITTPGYLKIKNVFNVWKRRNKGNIAKNLS